MDIPFPQHQQNQRVVLEHRAGPYAGLFQITGHASEIGDTPPSCTKPFEETVSGRWIQASLVKSTPRYVLYREIIAPEGLGTFDRRQK